MPTTARQAIDFTEVVRETSGHDILAFDLRKAEDKNLVRDISDALANIIRITEKTGLRFKGNRINEVGRRFEHVVVEELRKTTTLEVSKLGAAGYPDCVIRQGDRITYLEIKTTCSIRRFSGFLRSFYYTSGKKIESDARHLLLQVKLEEEGDKLWKVVAWEMRDLFSLKTRLRPEFNAGLGDYSQIVLLASSTKSNRNSDLLGQTRLDGTVTPPRSEGGHAQEEQEQILPDGAGLGYGGPRNA